ncbi:hypothetical protein [Flavihumibacter profundi]|uniref:hypothetical protein n=1 Tax=Flavihumibacter profundi TaxID=2716883 RepID=UPI001CC7EE7D|nr:hypothetical protein [Flavihumibacter profundi]MBZ5857315.1 hypothetical protein [Flavihumibacter profundi]
MRIFKIAFLIILSTSSFGQNRMLGRYRDYFGSRVELSSDSTFKYSWQFDLASSWTKGTWTLVNDTLFFHMKPIYDTLLYLNRSNSLVDTLILSEDEKPERISFSDTIYLSSGGQNYQICPDKLFFKNERLYKIWNGSLVRKKQKGFWTGKKWDPWFFKSED